MKNAFFILLLLIGLSFHPQLAAQNQQTPIEQTQPAPDDEFSLFLFSIAIVGVFIMCICVGAGIVLTAFILLVLLGLVSWGVISASVIVGLHTRSFQKGFRTFVKLASAIGGGIFGAIALVLLNYVVHWYSVQAAALVGFFSGLLAGLLLGLSGLFLIRKLTGLFQKNNL